MEQVLLTAVITILAASVFTDVLTSSNNGLKPQLENDTTEHTCQCMSGHPMSWNDVISLAIGLFSFPLLVRSYIDWLKPKLWMQDRNIISPVQVTEHGDAVRNVLAGPRHSVLDSSIAKHFCVESGTDSRGEHVVMEMEEMDFSDQYGVQDIREREQQSGQGNQEAEGQIPV